METTASAPKDRIQPRLTSRISIKFKKIIDKTRKKLKKRNIDHSEDDPDGTQEKPASTKSSKTSDAPKTATRTHALREYTSKISRQATHDDSSHTAEAVWAARMRQIQAKAASSPTSPKQTTSDDSPSKPASSPSSPQDPTTQRPKAPLKVELCTQTARFPSSHRPAVAQVDPAPNTFPEWNATTLDYLLGLSLSLSTEVQKHHPSRADAVTRMGQDYT
ncbi:hypothetical protein EK21DRAFT_111634 [Setomelanomma holmii]|uniref:Uncharacterized protein n=1 Tax=Setomelanomma holmii TaxID=210430 RepID=A0A9P4H9Y0_9PLEO|nr:hypothetical protein EK21DRAFT_111634 [Setomelanomma holmii]